MINSIIVRTDSALKKRFEKQAKNRGLTMTFLIRSFMETYAENPDIMKVGMDEELLDQAWQSAKARASVNSMFETLAAK